MANKWLLADEIYLLQLKLVMSGGQWNHQLNYRFQVSLLGPPPVPPIAYYSRPPAEELFPERQLVVEKEQSVRIHETKFIVIGTQ